VPLFERGNQCILRQLFGQSNVAHEAYEPSDEAGRLRPKNVTYGVVRFVRAHARIQTLW
jgi:hypothetical protein